MNLIVQKIEGPVSLPVHVPSLSKLTIIQKLSADTEAEECCRKCCEVLDIQFAHSDFIERGTFPYSLVLFDTYVTINIKFLLF